MRSFTDQINSTIQISFPPKRIVSLVPSQTELLFSLGLETETVGITKFCIHPQSWFVSKKRIGGPKTLKAATIKALQPDLIIGNKEENIKKQIEELQSFAPVWISDIKTIEDALKMILSIGEMVDKTLEAEKIVFEIKAGFQQFKALKTKLRTAYLIWKDPYMVAGGDTFINCIMERCGFENIFKENNRYPVITIEELFHLNCELLLLSSEPYPFKEKHVDKLKKQLPETKIVLADGEMFSWYGSRLLLSPSYLANLLKQIVESQP